MKKLINKIRYEATLVGTFRPVLRNKKRRK